MIQLIKQLRVLSEARISIQLLGCAPRKPLLEIEKPAAEVSAYDIRNELVTFNEMKINK